MPKESSKFVGMQNPEEDSMVYPWLHQSKTSSSTDMQQNSLVSETQTLHSSKSNSGFNSNSAFMTPHETKANNTLDRDSVLQMAPIKLEKMNANFINNSQQLSQIMSQVEGTDLCSQTLNGVQDDSEMAKLRGNAKRNLFSAMSECEENDEMEEMAQ